MDGVLVDYEQYIISDSWDRICLALPNLAPWSELSTTQVPTNHPPRNEHLPRTWMNGEKRESHGGKREWNRR